MKVNKLNYETYIIDYLEGTLSQEDRLDFEIYLQENPSVKVEMEEFLSAPVLEEDLSLTYERKPQTKKKRSGLIWIGLLGLIGMAVVVWMLIPSGLVDSTDEPTQKEIQTTSISYPGMADVKPSEKTQKKDSENIHDLQLKENQMATTKSANIEPIGATQIQTPQPTKAQSETESPDQFALAEVPLKLSTTTELDYQNNIAEAPSSKQADSQVLALEDQVSPAALPSGTELQPGQKNEDNRATVDVVSVAIEPIASLSSKSSIQELHNPRIIEMVVVRKNRSKGKKEKSGWRKVFTPQSYENIKIGDALTSQNLKSAVEGVKENVVPEIFKSK